MDPLDYRSAIGRFATGVCVITCDGPEGPVGLTTNAVTSLSLVPALLLVCIDNASRTLPAVRVAERFAVNVLAADQEPLARTFASKELQPHEKLAAVSHEVAHGVPVLDGALAWLACDHVELLTRGDHTIAVGEVTHTGARVDDRAEPLLFFGGRYRVPAA